MLKKNPYRTMATIGIYCLLEVFIGKEIFYK